MPISAELTKAIEQIAYIESTMATWQLKADEEIKNAGVISKDTLDSINNLGDAQHELAERLLVIEQQAPNFATPPAIKTLGGEFIASDQYAAFVSGQTKKCSLEIQDNTLTGSDVTVAPDRQTGIVPGDFQILTLESLFPHIPTTSNAIEFTKEASFTDNAAEAAEGVAKAESALTWSLVNMPVSTVAHFIRISRQLAADAPALAVYVNTRMVYGVQRRVEVQLGAGDGVAPNISGILDAGNFTAHGYAAAALGTLKKVVLIRKIIADLWTSGFVADAILMNPADAATLDIDIFDVATHSLVRVDTDIAGNMRMFGIPIIQSNGITADNIAVGAFNQAGTIYEREAVVVELSDSDATNFTTNLVTIRAERRLALTIEQPSAIIAGDLTPI